MSPKQAAVYKSVLKHLRAEVDAGVVTIANAAVQLTKLLQISCGFVYTTDGLAAELDPKPRLAVIAETVAEAQAKFLVFCPFRAGVTMIAEHLRKEGWTIGEVTGDVSEKKRSDIFRNFIDGPLDGIVAHPGTMSHGLNLQVADMIVWSAPIASLETYEQANARITRPGQTKHQMVVQITGSPVEHKVYRRLDGRAAMQRILLDMFDKSTDAYLGDDAY
jgi:SNF2 family DNA or RNA helicase